MSSAKQARANNNNTEEEDLDEDDTSFISTCHSVTFDAPISHICNCVYRMTNKKKSVNCLSVAGRDGFIRIFESEAPFSLLFAFPIRYERVLSLEFLPTTSSFISVEHTPDGSGNHVVIYEDWNKFPNLLKNVQVVEKGEDIIFNFVSHCGLASNGYIAITSPGNMRLKSFQVEGINRESKFTFDVKIRTIQVSYDGTIISSNTIVNASPSPQPFLDSQEENINNLNNSMDINASLRKRRSKSDGSSTTLLVFELRTHKNIHLGPGAYRLSFPVAWKSRSRQRFRRELFAIELCNDNGKVIEAAQQLWIMDSDTANAAAQGYTKHPRYGHSLKVCAENIRSLRKPPYIKQMKIFELGDMTKQLQHKIVHDGINEEERMGNYTSQSWFPSDFTATGSDLNESVSCMNVCKQSGRIVTCAKSLISIWDCDLLLRTYKIPHENYVETVLFNERDNEDDIKEMKKVSRYRLGSTTLSKKQKKKRKIRQMVTIRTPPLKILSLHASFIVKLLDVYNNYLAFSSDSETRMVYLDIDAHHNQLKNTNMDAKEKDIEIVNKSTKQMLLIDDYSSGEEDQHIIIDIYDKMEKKLKKKQMKIDEKQEEKAEEEEKILELGTQVVDLSDTDSNVSAAGTPQYVSQLIDKHKLGHNKRPKSSMRNVSVVFDSEGCPSIKHHAASFMLIPSIYEFNRFVQSTTKSKNSVKRELGRQYPFQMIGDFADHAHRIDLSTQTIEDETFSHFPSSSNTTSLSKKLIGNVVILDVDCSSDNNMNVDVNALDYNVIEKEILDRSQAMFDINQISQIVHRRFESYIRIRALQIVSFNKLLVGTDEDVFVYDLYKRKLSYCLNMTECGTIIETCLYNTFLFVLTENSMHVYSSEPTETGELLLLWSHPLLRMRGLKILEGHNKFCLEFGSQTEMDRFSVNADGKRIRLYPFDLRLRIQSPNDPEKRPLTIFEENSPKNILLFEWAPTSEMVLSLITKSHEAMTQKIFQRSRHLLIIALELIKIRKSYLYPLYKAIKKNKNKYRKKVKKPQRKMKKKEEKKEPEVFKKSLSNLISSAWNWMSVTNPINAMAVGNSSSLSNASNVVPKKSVIQSEWQMLKQLKKQCHGLLADVYVMENKYDIAAQHYILSNRQFIQIRQLFFQHIHKNKQSLNLEKKRQPIDGLTLFYRLFLEHKSRIDHELNAFTWNCIMEHFKIYECDSFSTIFLHPFMLNTKFNLKTAVLWLDECIDNSTNPFYNHNFSKSSDDPYITICPSSITPTNVNIIKATHYLAKVVLLCLKNDIESASETLSLIESANFMLLLQSHKRLWLEWSHSKTFRRLCCVIFPWEFAKMILEYSISCYQENEQHLKTVKNTKEEDDHSEHPKENDDDVTGNEIISQIEQLFPLRRLNFNESLQYFEYQSAGPSLMQCYLEGGVRYLVEQIDEFETIQIETNRSLPESDHALYLKYLAEIEEIGFTLIELYVQYLQKVCYDDTTNILMGNINILNAEEADDEDQLLADKQQEPIIPMDKPPQTRAIFGRKRHIWNSQYPVILRQIPSWLTQLLEKVQAELFAVRNPDYEQEQKQQEEMNEDSQNEQMIVMTRICTLLSCIEFGSSITKREKGAFLQRYRDNKHINFKSKSKVCIEHSEKCPKSKNNQWKRRLDLLLASCPDIPSVYVNAISIIGYVACGSISDAIHIVLQREQSIITQFALSYCKSLSDWRILLKQILKLIKESQQNENHKQSEYLQKSCRKIWRHLGRLSSLSTKQSEWLSVMDLISLVPDDGNLEFFAPIFSDLCRNQAGDSLNMQLFDRIVQVEKDKDYGFNQQMHEIFYPQQHQ